MDIDGFCGWYGISSIVDYGGSCFWQSPISSSRKPTSSTSKHSAKKFQKNGLELRCSTSIYNIPYIIHISYELPGTLLRSATFRSRPAGHRWAQALRAAGARWDAPGLGGLWGRRTDQRAGWRPSPSDPWHRPGDTLKKQRETGWGSEKCWETLGMEHLYQTPIRLLSDSNSCSKYVSGRCLEFSLHLHSVPLKLVGHQRAFWF